MGHIITLYTINRYTREACLDNNVSFLDKFYIILYLTSFEFSIFLIINISLSDIFRINSSKRITFGLGHFGGKMAISRSALAVLNNKADYLINPTLLVIGSVSLLPAPYDVLQVAGIFIKMGHDLAIAFCLPMEWALLREIGVAMADSVATVFAAPWSSILSQRDHVATIAYAVGHCFKQYFNLILTTNCYLLPSDMGLLAENTLCASLNYL